MDRPLSSQPPGRYIYYAACGSIQNTSGQNLIYTTELLVHGVDGTPYQIEQDYDNLVPRKYGPLGIRFGCGISNARDYDLTRVTPSRAQLLVHYTLDSGETGTVEISTTSIRE